MNRRSTVTSYWARHYQDAWHERAGDPRLPHWLRVAALAYGSHGKNGHAKFKRGDVALILGTVDRPYANVRRAIALAVEYGWLEEGSYYGCMIVPPSKISMGDVGVNAAPCPHAGNHKERRNRSLSERNGRSEPTLSERFEGRSVHSVSAQRGVPSISSVQRLPTTDPQARESA